MRAYLEPLSIDQLQVLIERWMAAVNRPWYETRTYSRDSLLAAILLARQTHWIKVSNLSPSGQYRSVGSG